MLCDVELYEISTIICIRGYRSDCQAFNLRGNRFYEQPEIGD